MPNPPASLLYPVLYCYFILSQPATDTHYQNYTHGSTGIQFLSSFCLNTRVQAYRFENELGSFGAPSKAHDEIRW